MLGFFGVSDVASARGRSGRRKGGSGGQGWVMGDGRRGCSGGKDEGGGGDGGVCRVGMEEEGFGWCGGVVLYDNDDRRGKCSIKVVMRRLPLHRVGSDLSR
ncbi:TBC1 domain family member 15 [Pyrus ussuriensis x Pyrus communis]|uniref:TBC1 domain family member 15 n=1 Tax=Pyrus ussuriensis x Pyrus communis TaxID=2448454 RepID=A0A5N5GMY7_9ROSA|nr:TBC1 domain family member 15 [Pyrus ussuriensis x Pyrus communis]